MSRFIVERLEDPKDVAFNGQRSQSRLIEFMEELTPRAINSS
ncbi:MULTISPECIES: hypothetical protein [Sinorhizobium]|nr:MULTISPECIES: hypothetical protein [Sinorhizobium]